MLVHGDSAFRKWSFDSQPPFLYELGAEAARTVLDDLQAAPVAKAEVADKWITVPAEVGDVRVRILRPVEATGSLPTILYMHGGGWVIGSSGTHDRLIRELSVGVKAASLLGVRYPMRMLPILLFEVAWK